MTTSSRLVDVARALPRAVAQRLQGRFVGVTLAFAFFIGSAAALAASHRSDVDRSVRKARLTEHAERDRAASPGLGSMLDFVHETLRAEALAGNQDEAAVARGELSSLLAERGLYVRAVAGEIGSPAELSAAAQSSRKDSFVACLMRPPSSGDDEALRAAAVKYRWRVALDRVTPNVEDLDLVESTYRTASAAFAQDIRAASDPSAIRMLEIVDQRARDDIGRRAVGFVAGHARWLAVLLDDMAPRVLQKDAPALAHALKGSRVDDAKMTPHAARALVIDLVERRVVARASAKLDASQAHAKNANADAEEIMACQAAMAIWRSAR